MMYWKEFLLLLGFIFLPIFPDPYYHEEKVSGLEWVRRELDELLHGEADGYKPWG